MEEKAFAPFGSSPYVKAGGFEKEPMEFTKADLAFAFGMLICGFLFWNLIDLFALGMGVTAFAVVICAVTLFYLQKSGVRQNWKSLICLGLVLLSAVQFSIFDIKLIKNYNFLFLMAAYVYWVCVSTERQIEKKLSVYMIGDGIKQGIILPFLNFTCCFCGIRHSMKGYKKGKSLLSVFVGIIIALPLLAGVIHLLTSADFAFEAFVRSIYTTFRPERFIQYIGQFLLGIPVAFYLYGLVYGDVKGRNVHELERNSMDGAAAKLRFAPRPAVYSALTAFNGVYLIFFCVQAAYFFSAFHGTLPDTFTYAEYARRGFFELCTVAGINLGILTVSYMAVKRNPGEEPKALRIQIILISLFTMLLIVTAFSKMALYIQTYGLTQLRVFTSWFMLLLFFIFLVVLIRQIKKFNGSRLIIVGFAVLFMTLAYGNVDGMIAKYNIERYKEGSLAQFDYALVMDLSDAAMPYVYDLYAGLDDNKPEDQALKVNMKRLFMLQIEKEEAPGAKNFRDCNWQQYRADGIRSEIAK